MQTRPRFWRWVLVFGALGLVVPMLISIRWFLFHKSAGEEAVLWPSSVMFMALDDPSPSPMSTVVLVYSLAFIENFALYATVGALFWPFARLTLRIRNRQSKIAKPST